MLVSSLRSGLVTVRRAGWRGVVLCAVSWAPVLATAYAGIAYLFVLALLVQSCLLVALIAHLGARMTAPLTDDVTVPRALRRGVLLVRPATRVTLLEMLAVLTSVGLLLALSGGRALTPATGGEETQLTLAGQLAQAPLTALLMAFILLARQRVALERDSRVLVAAAHSVRIARAHYGTLFALALAEPAVVAGRLLLGKRDDLATLAAFAGALIAVRLVVTATANELFAEGPRLDVPADFGKKAAG